jgi:hypothetical protein
MEEDEEEEEEEDDDDDDDGGDPHTEAGTCLKLSQHVGFNFFIH